MYQLYYSPGACSKAVHIALCETGADYEGICCTLHGASKDAELLSVNPRHSVPVLVDDGFVIREGAAMMTYLLDKERCPLLPASGHARGAALEWLSWCNASLHPAYSNLFAAPRVSQDAAVQGAIASFWQNRVQMMWDEVEAHLANNKYLAGSQMSIGDILMTVIAQWQPPVCKTPFNFGPNTMRVMNEVKAMPSWTRVTEDETAAAQQKRAA